MAKTIRTRLEMKFDPSEPMRFVQEEAYQKARFELLHELLNLSAYYPTNEAPATKE